MNISRLLISRTVVGTVYGVVLAAWILLPNHCTALIRRINDNLSSRDGPLHRTLETLGVPPPYPNAVDVVWGVVCICLALATAAAVVEPKARHRAEELRLQLLNARSEVDRLHYELLKMKDDDRKNGGENGGKNGRSGKNGGKGGRGDSKPIRVFMEGAFDIMHYGHMNAFRQGAALGDILVVGVNSSESIEECKGSKPVMSDEERCAAVQACRFVDEVIPKTPYVMTREYLDHVIKTYNIDFVVHGDDPCFVNGRDVYEDVKKRGMFRSIPVTEGVSTTDIVGRMLLLHKEHHIHVCDSEDEDGADDDAASIGSWTSDASADEDEGRSTPQQLERR